MKFGGTSVGDVCSSDLVFHIVLTQLDRRPVVVVSAMTKVTDALLDAFEIAKKGDPQAAFESLDAHFERHSDVCMHFIAGDAVTAFNNELEFSRRELSDLLTRVSRRSLPLQMLKDAIVAYGEQLSSRLLTEVLKAKGVSARHVDSRRVIV